MKKHAVHERRRPMRTCVGCRVSRPKEELLRLVRTPSGECLVDDTGRQAGRGTYLCPTGECRALAVKTRRLQRALGAVPGPELLSEIEKRAAGR